MTSVLAPYNVRAPMAVAGEDEADYCRRLVSMAQDRLPSSSPLYKINLGAVRNDALNVFADQILEEAKTFAYSADSVPA